MAYVTPKTNWTSTDGVTNADLNRIEENTRVLSQQGNAFGVTTGAANTYAVTAVPAITALGAGTAVAIQINVDNTAASTINVNGLGPKSIKKANGNDVGAANLKAGSIYTLRYNGTNFILQGEGGGEGTAVAADVLAPKTFTNSTGQVITGTAAKAISSTDNTNLVNAINAAETGSNELLTQYKTDIVGSIGSPATVSDSFLALAGMIDNAKAEIATKVGGLATESLDSLAGKVTTELSQVRMGQFSLGVGVALNINNLPFTPTTVVVMGQFISSDSNRWNMVRAIKSNVFTNEFSDNRLVYTNSLYAETHNTYEYTGPGQSQITLQPGGFSFPSNGGSATGSWIAIK